MSKRIEARDSRVIKSMATTDGYRDGWEAIWGKKNEKANKKKHGHSFETAQACGPWCGCGERPEVLPDDPSVRLAYVQGLLEKGVITSEQARRLLEMTQF